MPKRAFFVYLFLPMSVLDSELAGVLNVLDFLVLQRIKISV